MRLAAKWQTSWTMVSPGIDQERVESIRLGDECVDLLRLGHGDPLVLVPGLAGSWKLVLPLARSLARHFEVVVYGLRGDRSPWDGSDKTLGRLSDIGEHANDLARLIEKLELRLPRRPGCFVWRGDRAGIRRRASPTSGCLDRAWSRSPIPIHIWFDDRALSARAIPVAERQSIRQPVFQSPLRCEARARSAHRFRGRPHLGNRPERHGSAACSTGIV